MQFAESELREVSRRIFSETQRTSKSILLEEKKVPIEKEFDIFLSHSYLDSDLILGLKKQIEDMGFFVYVDWVEDEHLERSDVSKETAELLRQRMGNCKCLFFATSDNSKNSKWMPWECGYFDGKKGKVAICPITKYPFTNGDNYNEQEYLGLYPYITKGKPKNKPDDKLWVHESASKCVDFTLWLRLGLSPCTLLCNKG